MVPKTAVAIIAVMMFATSAQALSITADNTEQVIAPGQAFDIPVTVSYSNEECLDLVAAGGSANVAITSDLPSEWGFSGTSLSVSASDCLANTGTASADGTVSVTPSSGALAYVGQTFTLTANDGSSEATFDHDAPLMVDYVPGHTTTPDIGFPYDFMGGDELVFNVTMNVEANGDTMVMILQMDAGNASISGLSSHQFFLSNGADRSVVKTVTWTPPRDSWETETIEFYTYSHCLAEGFPCDPQMEDNVAWTINNAGGNTGGEPEGEESPGIGLFVIVGLLGVAAVIARRK